MPALTDLIDEIRQMRDVPVPDAELAAAKKALVGELRAVAREPERDPQLLRPELQLQAAGGLLGHLPARISAITAAEAQRVAKKYWAADRLQIVAVGEPAKVEPALKKLGDGQGLRRRRQADQVIWTQDSEDRACAESACLSQISRFPNLQALRSRSALIFSIASPNVSISSSVV